MNLVKDAHNKTAQYQIIDARSQERFLGEQKEPRKGLYSGHIPNSLNLPFNHLFENGRYKSSSELENIFINMGIEKNRHIILTCGSGITACILAVAAYIANYRMISVYDGSWCEWGLIELNNPIERKVI
jgi:thiosulfate/3-mercaptopyruvate sulfurtransferase